MHDTAMEFGAAFFKQYVSEKPGLTIVDIGSQDVNGSLRSVAPKSCKYVGVDMVAANGVDIVIDDVYTLPFETGSVDVVVSSSCLEHAEFFWLVFNDALRILKPTGLLYLDVPSNGPFHRYPVDCWRFYPDCGVALQNWGRKSGYRVALLESFVGMQKADVWNDFVAVFVKDEEHASLYPERIQKLVPNHCNGRLHGLPDVSNFMQPTEDQRAHAQLLAIVRSINEILK